MTRLMKRLRRRGKRLSPTWRMVFYVRSRVCKIIELVCRYGLIRKAGALMRDVFHLLRAGNSSYGKP